MLRNLLPFVLFASGFVFGCAEKEATGADDAAQTSAAKGVFDEQDPALDLRIELPLKQLIVTNDDGAKADVAVDAVFLAPSLGVADPVNAKVKTRGNSSLRKEECDEFPKLKVKLDRKAGGFGEHRSFKIATHCGERGPAQRTPLGRVANEIAPWREAVAYRMLEALGLAVPRVRPVTITYHDTSTNHDIKRKATLIEDIDDVAERLGGKRLEVSPSATSGPDVGNPAAMDPVDVTLAHFGEALVGNHDFFLLVEPELTFFAPDQSAIQQGFWNIEAVGFPEGKQRPIVVDMDLSQVVAPAPRTFKPGFGGGYLLDQSKILAAARMRSSRGALDEALRRVRAPEVRARVEKAIDVPWLDDEGRTMARLLVSSFFDLTGTDARFYADVVASGDFDVLRADGTPDDRCVSRANRIPIGTPVYRWGVSNEALGLEQVSLLDARGQLPCNELRVWVKKSLVSTTDFPTRAQ